MDIDKSVVIAEGEERIEVEEGMGDNGEGGIEKEKEREWSSFILVLMTTFMSQSSGTENKYYRPSDQGKIPKKCNYQRIFQTQSVSKKMSTLRFNTGTSVQRPKF